MAGAHGIRRKSGQLFPTEQLAERPQRAGCFRPAAERVVDHEQVVAVRDLLDRLIAESSQGAGLPRDVGPAAAAPLVGARPHRSEATWMVPAERAQTNVRGRHCDGSVSTI